MAVWFNPKTGDIKYVYRAAEALRLKRQGYERLAGAIAERFFHFYALPQRRGGYKSYMIGGDWRGPRPDEGFSTAEEYRAYLYKLELIREITYPWASAKRALEDPQYLYDRLMSAVKRRKRISRAALDFALSLLPPELRQEALIQITLIVG